MQDVCWNEDRLPGWQHWLNQFCENWIYAFVVAMAIRGLLIEAYRIPSASMEPMLYGDVAMTKSDHVVVDRISHFFHRPERWEVTVFQYPRPEIWKGAGATDDALTFSGERRDTVLNRAHRNFVKRCVVLPGDRYYIAGGDLMLQQPDGSWRAEPKPMAVQNDVWLPVYRAGEQPGYLPWQAEGSAQVSAQGADVDVQLSGGSVRFTQPLIDLYLKPGAYRVLPRIEAIQSRLAGRSRPDAGQMVEVSMTKPLFTYRGGTDREGSVWDLDQWEVVRLTTADLDSGSYGAALNRVMGEQVGDVRVQLTLQSLDGLCAIEQREGDRQRVRLELQPDAWRLLHDGTVLVEGAGPIIGQAWTLAHVDDRVWVERGGAMLCEPQATRAVNPLDAPSTLWLQGQGSARLSNLGIDRDLHYSRSGMLRDERLPEFDRSREVDLPYRVIERIVNSGGQGLPAGANKEAALQYLREQLARRESELRTARRAREIFLGQSLLPGSAQALAPLGDSPERALTAPGDGHLLLGDNSPFSFDSRSWGYVPMANIRGEVLAVLFPRLKLVR